MSAPEHDDYDPTTESNDPQPASAPQPPALKYKRLDDFVAGVIARRYRREVTESRQRHWCPQWWRHAEAISRLEALWRAWEHLRLDAATGSSSWWLEHADPHMDRLFDPEGTFKWCSVRGGHKQLPPLPIEPPPAALFANPGGGFTPEGGQ